MQAISESGQIAKAHQYVDSHLPEHVQRFREIVHIPSIAAENPEGVRECAKLVQGWFKELGCREATIVETGGSPVVYGHYDARAKNTLLVYFMYDVKQVSGEHWTLIRDPFKPELLTLQPFRKVMVGRGAYNSKGPMTAFLNSLFSIKQTGGRIPINLKFIAEGEEELGSQHLIDFVEEYADRLSDGTACFSPAPSPRDLRLVEELSREFDEDALRQTLDVKHFLHDLQGRELLMKALYTTTLNIQGIEGGYTGPKFKTVLPHNVRVKLDSRIVPDQTRTEAAEKVRRHLDSHGYDDIRIVDSSTEKSDDWSRVNPDAGIVNIVQETYRKHRLKPLIWPFSLGTSPQYLWTKHLKIPFLAAGLGYGARAHAPDEYYVIEGNGEKYKVAGLGDAEKFYIDLVFEMAEEKLN